MTGDVLGAVMGLVVGLVLDVGAVLVILWGLRGIALSARRRAKER